VPPINDNFASRVVLTGVAGIDGPYTIDDATTEVGEQTGSAILNAHKTVWWEWTAPSSGNVTFDTSQSGVADTNLAIWTGTVLGSLTEVGSNEDHNHGAGQDWGQVTFAAVSGTTYLIQAGPFSALATGTIYIQWAMEAFNDAFANRLVIVGDAGDSPCIGIASATTEGGEPTGSALSNGIHQTLWFEWVAPGSGSVTFDTELSYPIDTTLAVWTGGSLGALVEVASDDDSGSVGSTSKVTFTAVSGTSYKIQLGTYDGTATGCAVLRWGGTLTPPTDAFTLVASTTDITLDTVETASFTVTLDVLTPPHTVQVNAAETNLADVDIRYTPGKPHLNNYTTDVTWTITVEATPLSATKTGNITFAASDGTTTASVTVLVHIVDPGGDHLRKREALKNIICVSTPEIDGGLRHFTDGNATVNQVDSETVICGGVQHGDWPRFWWIDRRAGGSPYRVGVVAVNTGSMGIRWMGEPFFVGRDDISYVPVGTTPDVTPILDFDPQSVRLVSDGTYLYCVAIIYVQDNGYKDTTELRNGDYIHGFGSGDPLTTARLACWRWEGGDDVGGETWSDWGWDDRILINQGGSVPSRLDDPLNPFFGYSVGGFAINIGDSAIASNQNTGIVHGLWMEQGTGEPYVAVEVSSSPGPVGGVTDHQMGWQNFHRILHTCRFTGPGQVTDRTILQDIATPLPNQGQPDFVEPWKDYNYAALGTAGGTDLGAFTFDVEDELSTTLFSFVEVLDIVSGTLINEELPSIAWACLPGVAPPTPGTGLLGNPGIMTVSDPQGSGITYADWIDHGYTWITFQAVNRPATLTPDLSAAQAAGFPNGVGVWGVVYDLGDFYNFGLALGAQAVALGAAHVIVDAEFCLEGTRPGGAQPIIDGLNDGGWTGPVHLSTLGSPSDPNLFDFEMDFQSFLNTGGGVLPQSYSNETRDYDAANCAIYWQRLGVPPEMLNYTIGLYSGALGRLSGADYLPLLQEAGVVHNFSIFLGETATSSDINDLDVLTVATDPPPDPGTEPCEPGETTPPLRLYWDDTTGAYYTIVKDVAEGYGGFYRCVTLSADGTVWDRLFRNNIDVSAIGHRIPSVVGPFGFVASYDASQGAVIGVDGTNGPVYIWAKSSTAMNGVPAGDILYGWNPCPAPGPRNSLAWGPYKVGNLSPFFGNPDVGDTTDSNGPYPSPQNFVAVTGNPNVVDYNLEIEFPCAVKIGAFVYVITWEHNRVFAHHPTWDTGPDNSDFRLYRFEVQQNIDSNTCPPLVPPGTSGGLHVWQRFTW
jgi:hypothetical protein